MIFFRLFITLGMVRLGYIGYWVAPQSKGITGIDPSGLSSYVGVTHKKKHPLIFQTIWVKTTGNSLEFKLFSTNGLNSFVFYNWGCISFYHPLSYPLISKTSIVYLVQIS